MFTLIGTSCPITDTWVVKWPVLEHQTPLTLKKQKELHQWMVNQAIQSAEHLVMEASPVALGGGRSKNAKSWNSLSGLLWTSLSSLEVHESEGQSIASFDESDNHDEL